MGGDYEQGLRNELSALEQAYKPPPAAAPVVVEKNVPVAECQPIRLSKSVYFYRSQLSQLGERSMSYSLRRENYRQSYEFLQQALSRIALLDYDDTDSVEPRYLDD